MQPPELPTLTTIIEHNDTQPFLTLRTTVAPARAPLRTRLRRRLSRLVLGGAIVAAGFGAAVLVAAPTSARTNVWTPTLPSGFVIVQVRTDGCVVAVAPDGARSGELCSQADADGFASAHPAPATTSTPTTTTDTTQTPTTAGTTTTPSAQPTTTTAGTTGTTTVTQAAPTRDTVVVWNAVTKTLAYYSGGRVVSPSVFGL